MNCLKFNRVIAQCIAIVFVAALSVMDVFGQGEVLNPSFPFWKTKGNMSSDTAINFLGTIDGNYLTFRTNNVRRVTIDLNGNMGLGTIYPQEKLHLSGIGSSARLEGLGTGGSYLANTTLATDKIVWADANGTVKGLPNGAAGAILSIDNTTNSPLWTDPNGLFWKLKGNSGIVNPSLPAVYGTTNILANENWIGTTDAKDFVIGTNTIERVRVMQTTGNVGIGTATPANKLTVQPAAFVTAGTAGSYAFAIYGTSGSQDITLGSSNTLGYLQSWNSKPLLLNSLGNYVGVNLSTAPIQNLDINGRVNITNGVIQRGTTAITATSDLGLYSQISANWIRLATNAAPIKFFTDQGGTTGIGTSSLVDIDNASGGGVAIGANVAGPLNSSPDASAVLDVQSTSKGMFVPRMTTAQRDAIVVSATREGLIIYNTEHDCFEWWDTRTTTSGSAGFWNSLCNLCEDVYVYSASSNGNNFFIQAGSPTVPKKWCVYVNAGVTLGASTQSGAALNFAGLPGGSEVTLYNSGTIVGGGGNGANGGQESDVYCASDGPGGVGSNGGDAIVSALSIKVNVINTGLIAGGGGGGGGGSGGCRAWGGGGGGGRGIPGGLAGGPPGSGGQRATGGLCTSCTNAGCAANSGTAGTTLAPGGGGCGTGNSGTGCFVSTVYNGGCGGSGGGYGTPGNSGTGATCGTVFSAGGSFGAGGAAGKAINGNGGGCSITNLNAGSYFGTVVP